MTDFDKAYIVPARVVVLDDHPLVAQGVLNIVSALAEVESVEITTAESLEIIDDALYIIDLELDKGSGFDLIERLKKSGADCQILVYTMHEEPWVKSQLYQYGIDGAVSKSEPIDLLTKAVVTILSGNRYFSPVFALSHTDIAAAQLNGAIIDRERQVLKAICAGDTSEAIAQSLGVSLNTVQTYRRRLLEKFNVANTAQLVYLTKGLL